MMPSPTTPVIPDSPVPLEINDFRKGEVLANLKDLNKVNENSKSISSNKSKKNSVSSDSTFDPKKTNKHSDGSEHAESEEDAKYNIEVKPSSIKAVIEPRK